ncbi:MAG: hypothetical protein ACM3WV_03690 [Bacillota bacterium]
MANIRYVAALLAAGLLLEPAVYGGRETCLLQNKFPQGKEIVYQGRAAVSFSAPVEYSLPYRDAEVSFVYSSRALEPDREGFFIVETKIDHVRIQVKDGSQAEEAPPGFEIFAGPGIYKVMYDGRGNPLQAAYPDGSMEQLSHGYGRLGIFNPIITEWPDRNLGVGDSWANQAELNLAAPGGKFKVISNFNLQSIGVHRDFRCAKILCGANYAGSLNGAGYRHDAAISGTGMGYIYFAVDEGWPVQIIYTLDLKADFKGGDKPESLRYKVDLVFTLKNKPGG